MFDAFKLLLTLYNNLTTILFINLKKILKLNYWRIHISIKSIDKLQNAIDVSHFQGQINGEKVKAADIQYAMAKATFNCH